MRENSSRRLQALKTEQAILQAALELMRQRDFEQVSIRDICREAGITTGAFYHHFSSKEDLLRRGFAQLDDHMERELRPHLSEPPLDRLNRVVDIYAAFVEGDIGKLSARYYQYRLSSRSAEALESNRYVYRAMYACLKDAQEAGLMAPGHTAEEVSTFCMRHFRGIVIDWILHDYSYPLLARFREDYALIRQLFQRQSVPAGDGAAARL